jgi:hypothetical protein
MLERQVIEQLDEAKLADLPFTQYVFVGFNYLTRCEERLFEALFRSGKALFYWDYDLFYQNRPEHEAGRFIRQNIQRFPNELPSDMFDNFRLLPKKIRLVSASTEDAAARLIPDWLTDLSSSHHLSDKEEWGKTAIVLCHEQLLLPALHSIPDSVEALNVTMDTRSYKLLQPTSSCNFVSCIFQARPKKILPATCTGTLSRSPTSVSGMISPQPAILPWN